jgi:hypothetical protein
MVPVMLLMDIHEHEETVYELYVWYRALFKTLQANLCRRFIRLGGYFWFGLVSGRARRMWDYWGKDLSRIGQGSVELIYVILLLLG